jgi:methionine synthase II (cobalamin-independent)
LYASLAAVEMLGKPRRKRSEMSGKAPAPCDMRQWRAGNLRNIEDAVMLDIARAVSK